MGGVLRHIRNLAEEGASDGELLERFASGRDERAFRQLVRRHGPMVLGACRRLLGSHHDAEDAFQAVFLILVRKANSIRRPEALGAWLHEVAVRTARRAQARKAVRRFHERQVPIMPERDFLASVAWRDLQGVLDDEVERLPAKLRVPFVLCYLEGQTYEQASKRLHCPTGTISRRLSQARELLRARLVRRGLALPAGVLAAALAEGQARAALTGSLVSTTVKAAIGGAAGEAAAGAVSTHVAALVEGGLRSMALGKVKTIATLVLTLALACTGAGLLARDTFRRDEGRGMRDEGKGGASPFIPHPSSLIPSASALAAGDKPTQEGDKKMTLSCKVLDPDGNPVAGARVLVLDMPKELHKIKSEEDFHMDLVGRTRSDESGRFQVRMRRPLASSSPAPQGEAFPPMILVRVEGYGLGAHAVSKDADRETVVIRLPREQVLRARFVDLQGEPVANVTVKVFAVLEKRGDSFAEGTAAGGAGAGKFAKDWFPPMKTDAQGRIQMRGVGVGQLVFLDIADPRFQPKSHLELWKTDKDREQEVVHVLDAPRLIHGRVTFKDTGKPAAGVQVGVPGLRVKTDAKGAFRINPNWQRRMGQALLTVEPPAGTAYLGWYEFVREPGGLAGKSVSLAIALPRGVTVHGRVLEAGSGTGLRGAGVCFLPVQKPLPSPVSGFPAVGLVYPATTGPDGSFTLTALRGPGHLIVKAAKAEFVPVQDTLQRLSFGSPGGQPIFAHAIVPVDVSDGKDAQDVKISLRRGVAVKGKLIGPDGKPVGGAQVVSRLDTSASLMGFLEFRPSLVPPDFRLTGCDPEKSYPVVFFQEKKNWGALVQVSGKAPVKPLVVRMEPCGAAKARFVTAAGQPVEGRWGNVEMLLAPGPSYLEMAAQKAPAADAVSLANIYRGSYQLKDFRTDAQGRITCLGLVPGVTYRLEKRDFTVRSGETLDVGDIVVDRRFPKQFPPKQKEKKAPAKGKEK
jgi:RNA polymerase sigma factor (sigma-70 family)